MLSCLLLTLLLISILPGSRFTAAKNVSLSKWGFLESHPCLPVSIPQDGPMANRSQLSDIGLPSNLIDGCSSGSLGRWKPGGRDEGRCRHYCHPADPVQDRARVATAHFVTTQFHSSVISEYLLKDDLDKIKTELLDNLDFNDVM